MKSSTVKLDYADFLVIKRLKVKVRLVHLLHLSFKRFKLRHYIRNMEI